MNTLAYQWEPVVEKAIVYARASGAASLQRQMNYLVRFAESRGFEVVAIFKDQGSDPDQRPELDQALRLLEQQHARVLIAEYPESLVRGLGYHFLELLVQRYGARLITALQ